MTLKSVNSLPAPMPASVSPPVVGESQLPAARGSELDEYDGGTNRGTSSTHTDPFIKKDGLVDPKRPRRRHERNGCPTVNSEQTMDWNIYMSDAMRELDYGQYDYAVRSAKLAIMTSNQGDAESFCLAGHAMNGLNRFDHAIYYFSRALALDLGMDAARKGRLEAMKKLTRFDEKILYGKITVS